MGGERGGRSREVSCGQRRAPTVTGRQAMDGSAGEATVWSERDKSTRDAVALARCLASESGTRVQGCMERVK
jgi:hypothetical protein